MCTVFICTQQAKWGLAIQEGGMVQLTYKPSIAYARANGG